MMKLADIAAEMASDLAPLPQGFSIEPDHVTAMVLVRGPTLGYAVSQGTYSREATKTTFARLHELEAEAHA